MKIIALILIVAGILALVYGGFTYTKATHQANLGPIEFQVKEKKRVNVPLWGGIVVLAAGVLMLLVPGKKS